MSVSPVAARMAIPSLADLEGVVADRFMEIENTWPATRVNLLEQTREILGTRFELQHSRNIEHIGDWFMNLTEVGTGAFGAVYAGCVREWDAHAVPQSGCVLYRLPRAAPHAVTLIIKVMEPLEHALYKGVPYSGHTDVLTGWVGERNSVREVMMGRLLNLLVVHSVTPHFPLIYEPFHFVEDNMNGFAMELAHMSFANFMDSHILAAGSDALADELLDVAILQLANGLLCAHEHYDFRHNDLHAQNAMMTYITDTTYNYRVSGSYYMIPNYGMCWKLIDFGYSSSRVFDAEDVAHAAMHSEALSKAHENFSFGLTHHAIELHDMLRLIVTAHTYVSRGSLPPTRKESLARRLEVYVNLLGDATEERRESMPRATIAEAYDAYVANRDRSTAKIIRTSPRFAKRMRSSGLLEIFFETLGTRFKVPRKPRGVVFDASVSPFAGGDIVLEGVHSTPIVVTKATGMSISLSAGAPLPLARIIAEPADAKKGRSRKMKK